MANKKAVGLCKYTHGSPLPLYGKLLATGRTAR
jgi:hypothetical protein